MKFGTLVRVVVFLAVFGWAGYTAAMVALDYFTTSGMVGQLVIDAVTKRKAAGGSPGATQEIASDVRGMILKESRRQGVALDEASLRVTPAPYAVQVAMEWRHPIALYGDMTLFDFTLWMDRSFETGF